MRLVPVLMAVALLAADLHAQCADGSPPPCLQRRVATAAPAIDPNRVAILPFRVTTADTLLGEGFAELLAAEFTGEGMPRAVDMGTTLAAWQRAGGRPRAPLSRVKAIELARDLGAGIVSEGSIVTLGNRVTISAALLRVPDGAPRGTAARVTVSADSIDHALRQVTAILGANVRNASTVVVSDGARYSNSPEALRAYLEGMALWRRGKRIDAARAFDRALGHDSLFARALYRRQVAREWGVTGTVNMARLMALRDLLSPAERAILRATYGDSANDVRAASQFVNEIERVASLQPDNADVLYSAGDAWYHLGSAVDPARSLTRALRYFEASMSVDSQATVLQHIIEIGHRLRDTALIRRASSAYGRTDAEARWVKEWLAAATLGDERWLDRLRREKPDSTSTAGAYGIMTITTMPAPLLHEMIERWANVTGTLAPAVWQNYAVRLVLRGRPAAAESIFAKLPVGRRRGIDLALLYTRIAGVPIADEEGVVRRMRADTIGSVAARASRRCVLALFDARRGAPVDVDTTGFGRANSSCATSLAFLRANLQPGPSTDSILLRMDTLVQRRMFAAITQPLQGYETTLLAEAWEKAGRPARALATYRYRTQGLAGAMGEHVWNYPAEGRLAAQLGDTVGAIRAYRTWLEVMRDAEPVHDGARAAVRAAVAALEKRTP